MRLFFYLYLTINLAFVQESKSSGLGSLDYSYWENSFSSEILSPYKKSSLQISTMQLFEMSELTLSSIEFYSKTYQLGMALNYFEFNSYLEYEIELTKSFYLNDFKLALAILQNSKSIEHVYDEKNYSFASSFSYKLAHSYLIMHYSQSTLIRDQSLILKYIEEFELLNSQIIYEYNYFGSDLAFLFEFPFDMLMLGVAWNYRTENIAFEINIDYDLYHFAVGFRYHPLLGISKSLSIAFLL